MRTPAVVFALLLIPSALFAQSPASNVIILQTPLSQNCPVGIEAHHSSQGAVQQVHRTGKPNQQGYNIALNSLNSSLIRQVSITLRGLAGAQFIPASTQVTADATETFTLTPGDSPKPRSTPSSTPASSQAFAGSRSTKSPTPIAHNGTKPPARSAA